MNAKMKNMVEKIVTSGDIETNSLLRSYSRPLNRIKIKARIADGMIEMSQPQ